MENKCDNMLDCIIHFWLISRLKFHSLYDNLSIHNLPILRFPCLVCRFRSSFASSLSRLWIVLLIDASLFTGLWYFYSLSYSRSSHRTLLYERNTLGYPPLMLHFPKEAFCGHRQRIAHQVDKRAMRFISFYRSYDVVKRALTKENSYTFIYSSKILN